MDVTGGDDALLVAQIEALRAEGCPDDELFDAYRELVALRLRSDDLGAAQLAVDELLLLAERATALQRVDAQHLAMLVALGRGDAETAIAHGRWTAAKMRALALDGDHPHMLFQLSRALRLSGQHEQARTTLQEAVEGFEATEQPLYASLATLQLTADLPHDQERALLDRALELARISGDEQTLGIVLSTRGAWHAERDEYLPARRFLEQALEHLDDADDARDALQQLTWLHVRNFASDAAVTRAGELLALARSPEWLADACEARGIARSRNHDHAGARNDFSDGARALWTTGSRARALTWWARAGMNQILVVLHRLRWVSSEPHRGTPSARRELLGALAAYVLASLLWLGAWMLGGAMFKDYSARVLLLIVGMTPLQLVFAVIMLDMWCVLCEARDRRAQP